MVQYIDKDALVAKIEKAIDEPAPLHDQQCPWEDGYYGGLYKAEGIIDTLEVKEVEYVNEVDLEHLVKDFCYEYDNRKEKWYELCPNDRKLLYSPTWSNFAMSIANHFFELGIKAAQKGE